MKFSAAAIATALFAPSVSAFDSAAHITIRCKGVDFPSLTLEEEEFSAQSLMLAYNQVHQTTDRGDKFLSGLHWTSDMLEDGQLGQGGGNYNGGYHCNLCDPDNDDAELGADVGARAMKKWARRTEQLLKAGDYSAFANVEKCKIRLSTADAAVVDEVELEVVNDETVEDVSISVKCRGFSFAKLTQAEDDFTASALQQSYNTVHETLDHGDKLLTDLVFTSTNFAELGGGGGNYNGGYHCHLCDPDNDDAMVSSPHRGMKLWAAEFEKLLKNGQHSALHSASNCRIKMRLPSESEEAVELTTDSPVLISVRCPGVPWSTLTALEEEASASALKSTYNDVHKISDGGDKFLDNIHWSTRAGVTMQLRQGGGNYNGGYHCNLCDPDNDDAQLGVVGGRSTKKWEAAFGDALKATGFRVFKGAKSCKISMSTSADTSEIY